MPAVTASSALSWAAARVLRGFLGGHVGSVFFSKDHWGEASEPQLQSQLCPPPSYPRVLCVRVSGRDIAMLLPLILSHCNHITELGVPNQSWKWYRAPGTAIWLVTPKTESIQNRYSAHWTMGIKIFYGNQGSDTSELFSDSQQLFHNSWIAILESLSGYQPQ